MQNIRWAIFMSKRWDTFIECQGINAFRQHLRPDSRIHGIITHGGDAPNIIPDYTAGLFYVRSSSGAYRDELLKRVKQCCRGASLATGTEFKIEVYPPVLDPMKRNPTLEAAVESNMRELGIKIDKDDEDIPHKQTHIGLVGSILAGIAAVGWWVIIPLI